MAAMARVIDCHCFDVTGEQFNFALIIWPNRPGQVQHISSVGRDEFVPVLEELLKRLKEGGFTRRTN